MASVGKMVYLDEDFLKRVDDFADSHFLNRSALVTAALTQYMQQQQTVEAVQGLSKSMQLIATQGLDPEKQAEFERWADALKLLTGTV